MALNAATCIEVGITSFDDCPMFTWSLGCTGSREPRSPPSISIARFEITSFAFMFVEVPGARLEDVYHELVVMPAVRDLRRRLADGVRKVLVEQSHIGVHLRSSKLDLTDSPNEGTRKAEIAYGKVLHRPHGLGAIVGIRGHLELPHGIALDSKLSILCHLASTE